MPGHSSGIPVFGEDDASARTGWSVGHTFQRSDTKKKLKALAQQRKIRKHLVAENSHALGHGDYGVDHLLSAPPASKAQNTEQLAIELGMRAAAQKLNTKHGLGAEQSLVHAKISDVIHPKTGQLMARRFKLIRRADAEDKEGKVVFDHLMDGRRLHISKREAMQLGTHVHDSLMDDGSLNPFAYQPVTPHSEDDRQGPRGGIGGIKAPTRTALRQHQANVLYALQQKRRGVSVRDRYRLKDRKGVPMIGPAFTRVSFPPQTQSGNRETYRGQQALVEARNRAKKTYSGAPIDTDFMFHHSGSVPSDADSLMHAGMQSLRARLKETYRTPNPSRDQLSKMPLKRRMGIANAYNKVRNSGGDRSLLEEHERQLLNHLDKIRRQSQSAPRGKIIHQFDLGSSDQEEEEISHTTSSASSSSSSSLSLSLKKPRKRKASTMVSQSLLSSMKSKSSSSRMKRSYSDGPGRQEQMRDEDEDDQPLLLQLGDNVPEQPIEMDRKKRRKSSERPSSFPPPFDDTEDDW